MAGEAGKAEEEFHPTKVAHRMEKAVVRLVFVYKGFEGYHIPIKHGHFLKAALGMQTE